MKVILFLSLTVVLLCSIAFADHHKDHHGDKDDHHKKGDHHKHHHHSSDSLACHRIANQNLGFAYKLFRQSISDHPTENIVLSPISISTLLGLLLLGANSNTHDQILEGLAFNTSEISEHDIHDSFHHLIKLLNNQDSELQLDDGNALFIEQTRKILPKFLEDAKNFYHSEAFSTDFKSSEEAKKQINEYVEKRTHGMIPELLSSVNPESALVLVNYIYFRGKWEKPFEEQFTKEGDFHVNENKTVKVPFMTRTGNYYHSFNKDATVIKLPYKGNATALFILPNEGKQRQVEENLSRETMHKWKKSMHLRVVQLSIPKFSLSGSQDLKEILSKFGLVDMFSDNADFSGITGERNLKVSKALHKAVLKVDEKGTEAAGSTAFEMIPMSLPPHITFNRPFIVLIYSQETKSVLFTGKVANPEN